VLRVLIAMTMSPSADSVAVRKELIQLHTFFFHYLLDDDARVPGSMLLRAVGSIISW
jgi:hypothetical protein